MHEWPCLGAGTALSWRRWRRGLGACLIGFLAGCGGGDADVPKDAAAGQAPERVTAQAATVPAADSAVTVRGLYPVGVRVVSWPTLEVTYRLILKNSGPAVDGVTVALQPPGRGVQVIDAVVNAGTLPENSVTSPTDTIRVRHSWSVLFALLQLQWKITFGPPLIAGTVAVGAALSNAEVSVTDAAGAAVCLEVPVFTNGTGGFTCTVQPGRSAPFVVVANDRFKAFAPMVSVVTVAPQAGTTLISNVTPITTAIVSQLAPDGNALSVLSNPALIVPATLQAITANVLTQIAPVLTALGAPAVYDPFTTQIVAGTVTQGGNTADQVIEALRFTTVNGDLLVATVDNPAGAVPLADASTGSGVQLPPPAPSALSLADALRLYTTQMTACYAKPVNARVLVFDATIPATLGGPEVTGMDPACSAVAHPGYLFNGYRFGQRFNGLLRDPAMVGATFSPAEVMRFVDDTSPADNDEVVVNQRFVDANGVALNVVEVLRKLPGSATAAHPSEWWAYGNQQQVESLVRAFVRRQEQLAPNPGVPPFAGVGPSRFETGIETFINKDGPGSTGLRAARLRGPGLPAAGIVFTRPNPAIVTDQTWMNIRRKDGLTDPASATHAGDVGDVFRLQRSQGLAGAAPLPVQSNPNEGNANNTQFPQWAHPLDYGAPVGTPATGYIDFAALKANTDYTLELFYDGEDAPRFTYVKTMLSPIVPAPYAVNLRWHALTPSTLGLLNPVDPQAAELGTAGLTWAADPFAETVSSAGFFTFGGGLSVADSIVGVARGATSAAAVAPAGVNFRALTSDGTSSRTILLRYRMLDGSYKDSTWRFN